MISRYKLIYHDKIVENNNQPRKNFNEAVQSYNTLIRTFPNNMFAGMWGFEKKGYFKAEAGSDKAPEVKF